MLSPFQVPYGGYVIFPLSAGTHYLEVTLRGKPGGGLEAAFHENKPDAPVQGKGWELLDDGTVLHRKTGLIGHRNPFSPGLGRRAALIPDSTLRGGSHTWNTNPTVEQYVTDLNNGIYGADSVDGNAGYNDWRAPKIFELLSILETKTVAPSIS